MTIETNRKQKGGKEGKEKPRPGMNLNGASQRRVVNFSRTCYPPQFYHVLQGGKIMNDARGNQKSGIIDIEEKLGSGPFKRGYSATFVSDGIRNLIHKLGNDPDGREKLVKLARHSYFAVEVITAGLATIGSILSDGGADLSASGVEALGAFIEETAGIAHNQATMLDNIILLLAKEGGAQ